MARVDLGGGFSADPDGIQQVINQIQAEHDKLDHVIAQSKTLDNTVAPGNDPVTVDTFHKPMQALADALVAQLPAAPAGHGQSITVPASDIDGAGRAGGMRSSASSPASNATRPCSS